MMYIGVGGGMEGRLIYVIMTHCVRKSICDSALNETFCQVKLFFQQKLFTVGLVVNVL